MRGKKNILEELSDVVLESTRRRQCYTTFLSYGKVSVQFSSVAQSCQDSLWPMDSIMPGFPIHYQLPELVQTHVHQVSDAIQSFILCYSLLLLPSIFPSIRVFSNESALRIRSPKYWSFSFNISPSNEHPGLISFGMDWLNLLAVQGTHKNLLQHHSSKASILRHSALFTVQLSHPYMTIGKTIALTRGTFVDKVMSLLFNMLSAAAAAKSLQSCPTLCDPITAAYQAPPSLGFSRQEHWSGLPFPSPMHESEKRKWSLSVLFDS